MSKVSVSAAILFAALLTVFAALLLSSVRVSAEETGSEAIVQEAAAEADSTGSKAIAAAIVVGLAAAAGAIGMGIAVAKSAEGMARQPEASGKINSAMMLGLVFIETAIIYALIIAILIIFVL